MNVFTIKLPGLQETVCDTSRLPSGYSITGYTRTLSCPNYSATGTNAWIIQHA